jgi:hypothetical protein
MTIGTLRGRRLCKNHRHEPGYARFLTHPAVLLIFSIKRDVVGMARRPRRDQL